MKNLSLKRTTYLLALLVVLSLGLGGCETAAPPVTTPNEPATNDTTAPEAPTTAPEAPTTAPEAPTTAPEAPTTAPEAPTTAPKAPIITPTPPTPTPTPPATPPTVTPKPPVTTPEKAASETLTVQFGDDGADYTMYLEDNETAAAIAKHVGTAAWRLPIYDYDNFDNWEVMQYYDIPSRYDIPSSPQAVTREKAGEVYYSAPNRIVLFYGDAQVSGQYTKIGYFNYSEDFAKAVAENPVLEGWGNKILHISLPQ